MDKMSIMVSGNFLGWFIGAAVVGYLLGSLPFGLIFTRLAGLGDVRKIGSGNIGATNVLRTGSKKIAAVTLLADMLKGTLAVTIFLFLAPHTDGKMLASIAALCALLGHIFPLWLHFKGGKGVATYLGTLIILAPWGALAFVSIWLACAIISRYSSLSALIAVFVVWGTSFWLVGEAYFYAISLMSLLIFIKHYANIKRLIAGTETKISFSRKKP